MRRSRRENRSVFDNICSWVARMINRISRTGLVFFMCTLLMPPPDLHAESEVFQEYKIKAVFLFNLANFVSWPSEAFKGPDVPLEIGILGEDPFGGFLDRIVHGERVGGRQIAVKRFSGIADIRDCHVLFIGSSHKEPLSQIFEVTRNSYVLTVGEVRGFASLGGMVNLVRKKTRVHVEVNAERARDSGLGISSKLLKLARIVETEREEGKK
ncbi:MAG: YfiR family protein [Thermodesulfobacteriota bacterium]|nr:YfiR family protein [Thermodesulfobacteriota bacterium]